MKKVLLARPSLFIVKDMRHLLVDSSYEPTPIKHLNELKLHNFAQIGGAVISTALNSEVAEDYAQVAKSIKDIETFCQYDDTILDRLRFSAENKDSQKIIHRIDQRNLYKVVDTHRRPKPWPSLPTAKALAEIEPDLPAETIIVDNSCVGFIGTEDGHPMDSLRFYDSQKPNKSFTVKRRSVSTLLTARYCEYWTRIIVRAPEYKDIAAKAWNSWKASI